MKFSMADSQVNPPVQGAGTQPPAGQTGGVFGGSAEAIDAMVNSTPGANSSATTSSDPASPVTPVAPTVTDSNLSFDMNVPVVDEKKEDSGETFNFDEISFDNSNPPVSSPESKTSPVVPQDPKSPISQQGTQPVEDKKSNPVSDSSVDSPVVDKPQTIPEKKLDSSSTSSQDSVDLSASKAAEVVVTPMQSNLQEKKDDLPKDSLKKDKPQSVVETKKDFSLLHDLFDDLYQGLEDLYDYDKLKPGATMKLGAYAFVIKDFAEDIIKISKADVTVTFSLDSGSLEVLVNNQKLFDEEELASDSEKYSAVEDKLNFFMKQVQSKHTEIEKAAEQKAKLFEQFKSF